MIFENNFLVFFGYLILKVISQEKEIAAMLISRNYTEGLEKIDIIFCTNYCVKTNCCFTQSRGQQGTKERRSSTDWNHSSFLEQSKLNFGSEGREQNYWEKYTKFLSFCIWGKQMCAVSCAIVWRSGKQRLQSR